MKTLIWHVIAVKLGTLKRFHEVIPNPFKVLVRTDDISFLCTSKKSPRHWKFLELEGKYRKCLK